MHLLPEVKSMEQKDNSLSLFDIKTIVVGSFNEHYKRSALEIQSYVATVTGLDVSVVSVGSFQYPAIELLYTDEDSADEKYLLRINGNGIRIEAKSPKALFRAVQTLIQIVKLNGSNVPYVEIEDYPDFMVRGFYHDVTRGKVPTLKTLKLLVDTLAFYKYNHLQLYVEHTFAFNAIPELWVDKDPLTADEILELDKYCKNKYIDLVPSLSTFGHLYELLRLKRFEHLNELDIKGSYFKHDLWDRMAHYTINCSSSESFSVIKTMIEEYLPLFSSPYFNICCDETFDLGKGKNKNRVDKEGAGKVYVQFVKKIMDVVLANGKTPMLWGDIVLKYPEQIDELPKDAIYLNWDYEPDAKEDSVRTFHNSGVNHFVCPGVQGWSRFSNEINRACENITNMALHGKKYNASGILVTDWGDCGHVNFLANSYHGLAFGASKAWNENGFKGGEHEQFDSSFSVLQWGRGLTKTGSVIREMGDICSYHFGNIYAWVNGLDCLWNKEDEVKGIDEAELKDRLNRARKCIKEVRELRDKVCDGNHLIDFDEYLLSAELIEWTVLILALKKRYEYHQDMSLLEFDEAQGVILKGHRLLGRFQQLWRIRNKESELRTVVCTMKAALERFQEILQGQKAR
ncbi:family 20 glycosylhydrolase [Chitinispirillales bacterium ANBcel5]|uniref:beta-N-acetylhexosaminidase n=1 Tax=Cellulosispirillum alkaliphilum TaxID=3039283 RepID=UPI002A5320B9|nr:family 20 glycosylhydrolase [Chitinispirillales bacterium ANBcel5]